MSAFKALNLESDDESDVEIDDTKELQIEEALKLYQNALKFHSEGPQSFEQAAAAYEELFKSDIFTYPESQTELRRIELYGPLVDTDDIWYDGFTHATVAPAAGLDSGPSTLPQILHLSHKNYAQFKLEHLTAQLGMLNVTLKQILSDASAALNHFVEALDKDDTDLDLWQRTATVGQMLDSKRVARFCLEAILEDDEEGLNTVLSLPGLEESLAGEKLRNLVGQLEDQLSSLQAPLSTSKRRVLSKMLKQRLNTYESIKDRESALRTAEGPPADPAPEKTLLQAPNSWAGVGETLLQRLITEENSRGPRIPAVAVSFDLDLASSPVLQAIEPAPRSEKSEPSPLQSTEPLASINQQFPGLDNGQPTTQPSIACADSNMQPLTRISTDEERAMTKSPTMALLTRKRSTSVAGLNDGPEEGRTKSKRTRTRDSTIGEDTRQAILDANTRWELEQKLAELQAADDWMFETVGNLFERIGIAGFEAGKHIRQEMQHLVNGDHQEATKTGLQLARADLHAFLTNYSDPLAQVLTTAGENLELGRGANATGSVGSHSNGTGSKSFSKPTMPLHDGLFDFLSTINDQWLMTDNVAWLWICRLLRPASSLDQSTYQKYVWPENLKTMIVRTLVNFDDSFRKAARDELETWKETLADSPSDQGFPELLETIYELHLDVYCRVKPANSGVDENTTMGQRSRLQQWSALVREAMHFRSLSSEIDMLEDELNLRFLYTTTFQIASDADVSQDYVIECLNELRAIFVAAGDPVVVLQNNWKVPELSVAALDREISRLTTKDFFQKVTSRDAQDSVAIIESLEPLLDALYEASSVAGSDSEQDQAPDEPTVPLELVRFLESSDVSVRLLLWQRLRDAYLDIDYKPMALSLYFKMIRVILNEVNATLTMETTQADRQVMGLKSLRLIHDMTSKSMAIAQGSKDAFECIDEAGLKAAIRTFGEVLQLLQVFNVFEDAVRIGQTQEPTLSNGLTAASFATVKTLVHDMQVHIWVLLYWLLKESIFQFHELFPAPADDMFEFLRAVHRNLGLRGICGSSNRVFVRLLKDEFFQMTHVDGYDTEQAQVLYDLYGYNCFLDPNYELMDHNCTRDAFVDRSVAMQAVDLLLLQASKLPMKELVKHPLKDTIDKVHGAAPRKKPTDAIMRNREVQRAFLRSSINPVDLFRCLKGEGNQLNIAPIPKENALLASKGWYFLMGHIALAKFRSVKRTAPTPTEDVDIAIAFFMQDLEYSTDNWETWFRLAQAYDTKIEESVVWSAEKLNSSPTETAQLQRAAIHCYCVATAHAYRSADPTPESSEKMTELFSDFAMRLYASSREPFSMLPFAIDEDEKWLSIPGEGINQGKPFKPLGVYTAWKLAKVFFQKALVGRPESWTLYFALGKCLWKMHAASNKERGPHNTPPSAQQVLNSFYRAIELIPDKKDSREKREPVLEPHYKLVTVVHKMVIRRSITLQEAEEALSHTPYARQVKFPEEADEWVGYVLAVLKNLRNADKSNWHHRMIARAAHIIYDDNEGLGHLGALGAKHELTQQMFTKTMVLQVWRPECERAGRHFVYTSRYTRFFVRILEQLKDRTNLEMLARRVRRRPHDLFEHAFVWQDICNAYLRLLRNHAALPEGLETSTFSTIAHEEFLLRKEPLQKWMQEQETGNSSALDVLREVQELKKINQSLMKPGPIDDLIGDSYAYLFNSIGKQLWDEERRIKHEEEMKRIPPPAQSPPRNPMMSLTSLINMEGVPERRPSEPSIPTPAAPPTESTADPAPARRKIGVGRREIRTSAEACLQKVNTAHVQTTPRVLPRVQVVIDSSKEDLSGFTSLENSAPGSVYSADDESELSELEEEGEGEEENAESLTMSEQPKSDQKEGDETDGVRKTTATRGTELFGGFAAVGAAPSAKVATERPDTTGEKRREEGSGGDVVMGNVLAHSATETKVEGGPNGDAGKGQAE